MPSTIPYKITWSHNFISHVYPWFSHCCWFTITIYRGFVQPETSICRGLNVNKPKFARFDLTWLDHTWPTSTRLLDFPGATHHWGISFHLRPRDRSGFKSPTLSGWAEAFSPQKMSKKHGETWSSRLSRPKGGWYVQMPMESMDSYSRIYGKTTNMFWAWAWMKMTVVGRLPQGNKDNLQANITRKTYGYVWKTITNHSSR